MTHQKEKLIKRGFIEDGIPNGYKMIPFHEKIELLKSDIATNRTLGARALKENKTSKTVEYLITALKSEKKLYCKIEICNTLSYLKDIAIRPLISCLGKIGNNQHQTVPKKLFLKDSYPLPRDIASRTLIRIGEIAIPELLKHLKTKDQRVLSELIDTIGHIIFYTSAKNIYALLKDCYLQNDTNDLIKWKIICAMSGINESEPFLNAQLNLLKNKRLKKEINRSLKLIIVRRQKQQQQQQQQQ